MERNEILKRVEEIIEFKSREILSWDNVGDLIDSIEKKV